MFHLFRTFSGAWAGYVTKVGAILRKATGYNRLTKLPTHRGQDWAGGALRFTSIYREILEKIVLRSLTPHTRKT
jgi:hypothetical protein